MCASLQTSEQLLKNAADTLRDAGVETPILDAELLLAKATGRSRTELLTHPDFQPTCDARKVFVAFVERRTKREPLPYITGERPFYDLSFEVTPAVLIPRQETEFLVEACIHILRTRQYPSFIDIGVGSGAIALCIAEHVKDALVYGSDTSAPALDVARKNAESYNLASRVLFREGDMFSPFPDTKFDLVVSNPPYIPSAQIPTLQPEVSLYEPHQALDGGEDGLDAYRTLIPQSTQYLKENGFLALEIGIGQAAAVKEMCEQNGFAEVNVISDYSGIERVVVASLPSIQEWGPGPLVDAAYPDLPKELGE